jgi:hypothetical protein
LRPRSDGALSSGKWREDYREDSPAPIAFINKLALMPVYVSLLYEEVATVTLIPNPGASRGVRDASRHRRVRRRLRHYERVLALASIDL